MAKFTQESPSVFLGGGHAFIHIPLAYYPQIDTIVGTHDAPIRCVEYCPEVNVMVTGSWDRSVRLWDPRTPCNAGTFTQPEKVKGMPLFHCSTVKYVNYYSNAFEKKNLLFRCTRSLWLETGWSLALPEGEFWSGIWGTWVMYSKEESPVSSIRPAVFEPSQTNRSALHRNHQGLNLENIRC